MQVKRRPRHRLHAQVHRPPVGHHSRPARELRAAFPGSAHDLPGQLRRAGGAAFSVPGELPPAAGAAAAAGGLPHRRGGEGPAAGPAPVPDSGDRGGRGPAWGAGRAFRPAGQDPQQREDRRGDLPGQGIAHRGRGPGRDSLRAGPGRRRAGAGGALPAGRRGLRPETPGGPVRLRGRRRPAGQPAGGVRPGGPGPD